jgi:hypothetical protein
MLTVILKAKPWCLSLLGLKALLTMDVDSHLEIKTLVFITAWIESSTHHGC